MAVNEKICEFYANCMQSAQNWVILLKVHAINMDINKKICQFNANCSKLGDTTEGKCSNLAYTRNNIV